jgi:hypothetical protein
MSSVYIERLRAVLRELDTARESLLYVNRNWQRNNIFQEMPGQSAQQFIQTEQNVEVTYFVRLYAEFEGILKDHLATNHPQIRVLNKPKVDWLIGRIVQLENIPIEQPLRLKMDDVRDYRNSIAHRSRRAASLMTFGNALSALNTFLARLPDPLT